MNRIDSIEDLTIGDLIQIYESIKPILIHLANISVTDISDVVGKIIAGIKCLK